MAVGPWLISKLATADSGTATPVAVETFSASRRCAIGARLLVELHADRHLAVADVELGEVGGDVADGGDAHGLRDGLGGHAEVGGDLGLRDDAQLGPVELGRGDHVGEQRQALGLAGQLGRDLRDGGRIAAGDDELELALAVVLQEPVADVGHAGADRGRSRP